MYSNFEIWHQILLVKKSLRLHVKIFVTTVLFPVYLKKILYITPLVPLRQ